MKKLMIGAAVMLAVGWNALHAAPAHETQRSGAILTRGIHTTPEISQRCMDEIAGVSAMAGTVRQSQFLECVQRLSHETHARARHAARSQADSVLEESVVGLPTQFDPDLSQLSSPYRCQSEEHTSELQSRPHLVCRLLLEKKTKRAGQCCAEPVD